MKRIHPNFICVIFTVVTFFGCTNERKTTVTSFDGVSIRFDNEGKGEPAIILVHGWSNTGSIWDAQVSYFSQKYQVIAVDLPGFGKSGNNRSEWTIDSYGEDISVIIKQLNLKKVVLVGFSLGAPIVIEAAIKVPDKVIGLVLVDELHEVEKHISPPEAHMLDSVLMDLIIHPTKEKLVDGGFFKNNVDSSFQRIIKYLEGASHIGWRESLKGNIEWVNEQCINSISKVKVPIIAINSDQQVTNVDAFRKYVPTFKVRIIEDVGHLMMWDKTEEFNQLLEESIHEFIME